MNTPEKKPLSQNLWTQNSLVEFSVIHNDAPGINQKWLAEFRIMRRKLKAAENEIADLKLHFEDRVQQRTLELRKENKALEAFSYFVSHDLRAPIRAVTSFARLIQHEFGSKMPPKLQELFGYIIDSAKRMSTIIDDLLNLAKYSKGKLNVTTVDMTALIQNRFNHISKLTPHSALLKLGPLPPVRADRSMIEQVVVNLLSNAIKYSAKTVRPVINVWAEQTGANITYYFKDNGAGFDMLQHHRLFGAFQRLHGVKDYEGTGVGLMLVKSIIERHGGTVAAEGAVGHGAVFYFSLPA